MSSSINKPQQAGQAGVAASPGIRYTGTAQWAPEGVPGVALRGLDAAFRPRTVAVIGATERTGSIGRALMENLLSHGDPARIFPINPKRDQVLGRKCFPSITAIPARPDGTAGIDLAVIAIPAAGVPDVIDQCGSAHVPAAVVISSGFGETGTVGAALGAEVAVRARRHRIRVIGPNCMGFVDPIQLLNASFAPGMPKPGRLVFLSQSGAIGSAILDWSRREEIGFRAFVSTGAMIDVGWADLLDYFGDDPDTGAILAYIESIGDAREFLSAARELATSKPIVVIKPGRSIAAARAARAHTGADVGEDSAIDAAFNAAGVVRVDTIAELFSMADVLSRQPRPKGPNLAILTNGGGPAVLAADAAVAAGARVAELSPTTLASLSAVLPAQWSHGNPIDVLGDADAERYGSAARLILADPAVDGLLAIAAPQSLVDSATMARQLVEVATAQGKTVLACWMGGPVMDEARTVLHQGKVPSFTYPETAARTFGRLVNAALDHERLYETPRSGDEALQTEPQKHTGEMLCSAQAEGRLGLSDQEARSLVEAYGIASVRSLLAGSERDAALAAHELGFPVSLKIHSVPTLRTSMRHPGMGLQGPDEVRSAYRQIQDQTVVVQGTQFLGVEVQPAIDPDGLSLRLAAWTDPQLGTVIQLGWGGLMADVAPYPTVALPPLTSSTAARLIARTRMPQALAHLPPLATTALQELLVRFSRLLCEQRMVREIVIDPLRVSSTRCLAHGVRVELHPAGTVVPRLAIRPFPSQYVSSQTIGSQRVDIRPLRPSDEPALASFHRGLSEATVRMRYFHVIGLDSRIAHIRLSRLCHADYDRELALIAELPASTGHPRMLAVARLSRDRHDAGNGELAVVVTDDWQGLGLGSALVRQLLAAAVQEGYLRLVATVLPENVAMQRVLAGAGFELVPDAEVGVVRGIWNRLPANAVQA